jgi:hypothetical protein
MEALDRSDKYLMNHPDKPRDCEEFFLAQWSGAIERYIAERHRGYAQRMELTRWNSISYEEKKARYARSHRSFEKFTSIVTECVTAFYAIMARHRGFTVPRIPIAGRNMDDATAHNHAALNGRVWN